MTSKPDLLWCFALSDVSVIAAACGRSVTGDDAGLGDAAVASSEAGVRGIGQMLLAPTVTTLNAVGDTDIVQFTPTINSGASSNIRVTGASLTSWQAGLVKFDAAAMRSAVGTGTLQSASLELTVSAISLGWGNSQMAVTRMTAPWTESGATWLCANDTDHSLLGRFVNNCTSANRWGIEWWSLLPRPFASTPTATIAVPAGQQGVVRANVTTDIQSVLSGSAHQGWILTSTADLSTVWVQFSSREGSAVPKLVLTVIPSCTVVGVDTTCNGSDDDCDGRIDEAYVATSSQCGVGACARTGTKTCVGGAVSDNCSAGVPAASDATCDAIDNNCNGTVDEGYVATNSNCGVGACARTGTTVCANGVVADSCSPGVPAASDATCDGIDENCNSVADEGYISGLTSCGVGACVRAGMTSCIGGVQQDSCVPGAPAATDATCDGVDENCNGQNDEAFPGQSTQCAVDGCTAHGTLLCSQGSVFDTCQTQPICDAEVACDDSVDNDAMACLTAQTTTVRITLTA